MDPANCGSVVPSFADVWCVANDDKPVISDFGNFSTYLGKVGCGLQSEFLPVLKCVQTEPFHLFCLAL